jgi:WD40 repeat protein
MPLLQGYRGAVRAIAFSPDGCWLASGAADRTVRPWDLATGETRFTWTGHGEKRHRLAFSRDGRWLAAASDQLVRVYDLRDFKLVSTLGEETVVRGVLHPHHCYLAVAFSPVGNRFVAGRVGGPVMPWRPWTADEWREVPTSPESDRIPWPYTLLTWVCYVAFSPDGATLALINYSTLNLWDPQSGTERVRQAIKSVGTLPIMALRFSPDGRTLIFGSGPVLTAWDVVSRKPIAELRQKRQFFQDAAFSPDGRVLVTVSNEETAKSWDTNTWRETGAFAWGVGKLKCVAFAPDGMRAAAGGDKGPIVLWDVEE